MRPVSQGRPPERPSGAGGRPPGPGGPGGPPQRPRVTRSAGPPPPPPQRHDPFPYVMGGIIGALFVGLALVIYLLMNNQGSTNTNTNTNANNSNNAPIAQATSITDPEVVDPNAAPTTEPAPRMTLEDFKALYDDPARRPLIVDVRSAEAYQQGHIQGAVNIPEAELTTRIAEFPRDKMIVAYCQ